MARVTITPEHVEAALEAAGYATVDENIQAVLKEIKARPTLLTAYLSSPEPCPQPSTPRIFQTSAVWILSSKR